MFPSLPFVLRLPDLQLCPCPPLCLPHHHARSPPCTHPLPPLWLRRGRRWHKGDGGVGTASGRVRGEYRIRACELRFHLRGVLRSRGCLGFVLGLGIGLVLLLVLVLVLVLLLVLVLVLVLVLELVLVLGSTPLPRHSGRCHLCLTLWCGLILIRILIPVFVLILVLVLFSFSIWVHPFRGEPFVLRPRGAPARRPQWGLGLGLEGRVTRQGPC